MSYLLAGLSAFLAIGIAIVASIFITAERGYGDLAIRGAGWILLAVGVLYLLPVVLMRSPRELAVYVATSFVLTLLFGVLYFLAERNDPFRGEGEFGADDPFLFAAILFLLPMARAAIRYSRLNTNMPNQSSHPTPEAGRG